MLGLLERRSYGEGKLVGGKVSGPGGVAEIMGLFTASGSGY